MELESRDVPRLAQRPSSDDVDDDDDCYSHSFASNHHEADSFASIPLETHKEQSYQGYQGYQGESPYSTLCTYVGSGADYPVAIHDSTIGHKPARNTDR